eukprot:CAMPEP_0172859968 /NCGR_PEP_ID=MMETSP1075-20121228/71814_1 /TAXON_ID=2916 /ORGANISM="Ceratium fusus, Strain PA161109" /LENGTH=251 /DNA_ID=CAMNT_0013707929 /DNA_START=83 /DNA_END=838 /DNA_ORIENTATION=+
MMQEPAKKRQEERHTILPVSISILETAIAKSSESESGGLLIHGTEPGMLLLVGVVEAWSRQAMSIEFRINDATGRMKARYYVTGNQTKEVEEIAAGQYVSVFGSVRTAPELHFAVAGMRLVRSADEISYHMIEVAHSSVKLQNSGIEPITPESKKQLSSMQLDSTAVPQVAQTTKEPSTPAKVGLEGVALRKAVVGFLKSEGDGRPEGVEFGALCSHFQPVTPGDLTKALEHLVDAGDVFTTIDDEHYSCV